VKAGSTFESSSMNNSGLQPIPFSIFDSHNYVSVGKRQAVTELNVLQEVWVVHVDQVGSAHVAFDRKGDLRVFEKLYPSIIKGSAADLRAGKINDNPDMLSEFAGD
tara:strand:- start:20841 stop:21158 length:318 start_codon:yes stop_codon:yes gene_type:complete